LGFALPSTKSAIKSVHSVEKNVLNNNTKNDELGDKEKIKDLEQQLESKILELKASAESHLAVSRSNKNVEKSVADLSDTTCLFIISTPGSGSSTMVEVLSQCSIAHSNRCTISGENHGALRSLTEFHSRVVRTNKQRTNNIHAEAAWRKFFNQTHVEQATKDLVATMLNPNMSPCWGFKEIRYGREATIGTFSNDIEFLSSLCKNPKFILHSRKDATKEFNSTVLKNRWEQHKQSVQQHSCFDSYVGLSKSNICVAKEDTPLVFRHYLEDYLEENDNFRALWKYLGCTNKSPKGGAVRKVSKNITGL